MKSSSKRGYAALAGSTFGMLPGGTFAHPITPQKKNIAKGPFILRAKPQCEPKPLNKRRRLSSSPSVEKIAPPAQPDARVPLRRIENTHLESKGSCENDENVKRVSPRKDGDGEKIVDSKTYVRRDEIDTVKDHNVFLNNQLATTNQYNVVLKNQNKSLKEELAKLRTMVAQSSAKSMTQRTTRPAIEEALRKQVVSLKEEVEGLKATNQKLHMEKTTGVQAELEALKKSAAQIRTENTILKRNNTHLDQMFRQCKDDLFQAKKSQESFNEMCQQLKGSLSSLEQTVQEKEKSLRQMDQLMKESEQSRKYLHNSLLELKGNIRVFCRVRPALQKEGSDKNIVQWGQGGRTLEIANPSKGGSETNKTVFHFDGVLNPLASQEDAFTDISQLVQSALDGYKVSVFAYGQTGSGKTYTMMGPDSGMSNTDLHSQVHRGMIPRAVEQIFCTQEDMKQSGWTFTFTASFLEIYNEQIRDLLMKPSTKLTTDKEAKYEIKHSADGVFVPGLTTVPCTDVTSVMQLLERANSNRSTAGTKCNERSSRSHSIFTLTINGHNEGTSIRTHGVLQLIDLAGSERLKQSGAEGLQLKEAQHINKSLSALGDVIQALGRKKAHVPFRNSKLTHYLQDCLGSSAKVLMFVNVSPSADHYQETLCSLQFATKVNSCEIGRARRSVS
uniref:Kinesin-like protein n=1 Tax=Eutreptiella gymnastica TaxID=73025 RepID=A0A7S1NSE7_9EUGL|mmetsp:Transcript_80884/g.142603  ORF Transcript_80884/g.142603 Transcript_80884/m.142603 type:complete len:672 (+) Transcript_80884:175-2190(+)